MAVARFADPRDMLSVTATLSFHTAMLCAGHVWSALAALVLEGIVVYTRHR
jgi:hypothetical protein